MVDNRTIMDVVIPTFNNLEELIKCLHGFEEQTVKNFRILVCVDGSTDGTRQYLSRARFEFPLQILEHNDRKNKGRNATRNLSLPCLRSTYLLLFDSDIVPAPDLVENHLILLEKNDCISMGGIIFTDADKNRLADYIQSRGVNKYKNGSAVPPYYLTTQNAAFKTRYFVRLGGQDMTLTGYGGDDIDLGYRLGKQFNLQAVLNRAAVGHSVMNKDLDRVLEQMKEFGRVNLHILREKHLELNKIFRIDLAEPDGIRSRLIRIFLKESIGRIALRTLPWTPRFLGRAFIHYLFFLKIYQGYRSGSDRENAK